MNVRDAHLPKDASLRSIHFQKSPEIRKFRFDINGLRAIGVISVVAYHFGLPYFQGGFAGVDIFFAISGFLMTRIIIGGIDRDRFSVADFYRARFYRIAPTLMILILTVLGFVMAVADPLTVVSVSKEALSSILFVSNFHYATIGGYFSAMAESNWLLHSWSLAVECQFYLVYPLVLLAMQRVKPLREHRARVLVLSCVLLFLAMLAVGQISAKGQLYAFYMLPTRAWEMLAGGCIALVRPRVHSAHASRAMSLAGQAAILVSILLIRPSWMWPSAWTLLPVLGCCAVIRADRQQGWLKSAPAQMIGTGSYSIYLWHWPVVAAFHYFGLSGLVEKLVAVALSFALGGLFYVLLEKPLYRQGHGTVQMRRRLATGLAAAVVLVLAAPLITITQDGFARSKLAALPIPARRAYQDYKDASADWKGGEACPTPVEKAGSIFRCHIPGQGREKILLIGDSHLAEFIPRLAAGPRAVDATALYREGCLPVTYVVYGEKRCGEAMLAALDEAATQSYSRVILMFYWQPLFVRGNGFDPAATVCDRLALICNGAIRDRVYAGFVKTMMAELAARLRRIGRSGAKVYIVGPYPTADIFAGAPLDNSPSAESLYVQTFLNRRPERLADMDIGQVRALYAPVMRALGDLSRHSGAVLVDPLPSLCRPRCSAYGAGRFLYWDSHHLRTAAVLQPGFRYIDAAVAGR